MAQDASPGRNGRPGEGRLQRVPPHDPAAEQALLGAAMQPHTREVAPIVATLDPNVFYATEGKVLSNGLVADAIRRLVAEGVPVDTGTVSNALREDGQLEHIGGTVGGTARQGTAYLVALEVAAFYSDAQRAQIDADLLERLATKRRILTLAYAVSEGVYGNTDIGGLAASLVASIEEQIAGVISSWEPVNLAAILAGEGEETSPAILRRNDGALMLYPGRVHAFNAEPESAKTWLALWACLEVIERGGHVLYVDCEDSAVTAVERLLALGGDPGQMLDRFHYVRPDEPVDIGAAAKVKGIMASWPVELAVVDGVGEALAMSGWDEDRGPDVLAFLTTLVRPITRAGAAVLLIDHVVKDAEKRGGYATGSGRKKSGIDVAIELQVVKPFGRDRDGLVKVWVRKDRPGHLRGAAAEGRLWAELSVQSRDGGSSVLLDLRAPTGGAGGDEGGGQMRPTVLMERVSTWLAMQPGPVSARELRTSVRGKAQWVDVAVRCLVAEGFAGRSQAGVWHISRFDSSASDDPENDEQKGTEDVF